MTTATRRRHRAAVEPRTEVERDIHNGRVKVVVRNPERPGLILNLWLDDAEANALADQLDAALAPDCDTCPPGRPCVCTAASTDPLD